MTPDQYEQLREIDARHRKRVGCVIVDEVLVWLESQCETMRDMEGNESGQQRPVNAMVRQ